MGKGGKSKGFKSSFKSRTVIKPFTSKPIVSSFRAAVSPAPRNDKGGSRFVGKTGGGKTGGGKTGGGKTGGGKGSKHQGDSKGGSKGKGQWVFVPSDGGKSSGKSSGKSGGKFQGGKGKGKGKGKKRAAPLASQFWEKKQENENRQVLGEKTYKGTVQRYNVKFGYGFISPTNPGGLPQKVKNKLSEQVTAAQEAGKEVSDPDLLYFRKPDVNHEDGFKLTEDVAVSFKLYIDDKGAGACDVSQA